LKFNCWQMVLHTKHWEIEVVSAVLKRNANISVESLGGELHKNVRNSMGNVFSLTFLII